MVSPARKRDAATYLVRRFKISERRACQLLDLHRSTMRYQPILPEEEARLVKAMNTLADKHLLWGYRTVTKLLKKQVWPVNVKRIERL